MATGGAGGSARDGASGLDAGSRDGATGGISGVGGVASSGGAPGSGGAGGGRTDAGSTVPDGAPDSAVVDAGQCPETRESSAGKISHEAYLRAHSDLTHSITVKLRDMPWDPPACGGDKSDSAKCPERDQALSARQATNEQQVGCVLAAFGPPGSVKLESAEWYEPLRVRSDGMPTPIGTAFSVLALWPQIDLVARHPYVERIDPAPGEAARIGVSAPPIPSECPPANDSADSKLGDAVAIQGQGRQPVVIELRRELLPALRPCPGAGACDDYYASGWESTIVGRRILTCVRAWTDSKLEGFAPEVSYATTVGIVGGPDLPPFADPIAATTAFGLALTWQEVTQVAQHPYVQRVWTSPGLQTGSLPAGCPPDYSTPVPPRTCPSTTEATSGKFTTASQAAWQASPGANQVTIAVRRDSQLCPRPACPGTAVECPELERYTDRLLEEATASQACVRALIAAIGGTASSEVFAVGDSFSATLTWSQIQTVAAHPHVAQIEPAAGEPPPG